MAFNSAYGVLDALVRAYYDERDVESTLACVTEDIEWVGTENNDSAKGKAQLRTLLEADVAAFSEPFCIELDEPDVQVINEDTVLITVTGKQEEVPGVVGFLIRGTACIVNTENGWLVKNVHTSVPNSEREKIALQHELSTEREKQNALLNNVLGGVAIYRVKKDGRIATDYISDGLARTCGYEDGKDIMRVMAYDSRKLVLTEDFPEVAAACKESLEKGIPTSVNYRVYSKDGTPVRLTLDSIVVKNTELGEDDVAVFYAIQSLINDEKSKIIEDQKQMSELLDQMPGGLGLFELTQKGVNTVYMNNGFYEMIGTKRESREEYGGANTLGSAHPDDLPRINLELEALLEGANSTEVEYRICKDATEWIWIHANATVLKRENNKTRLCIAFYECTESKQRQLALLQQQRAVDLAQQQGNISVWTYNIDKGIITQQTQRDVDGHMGYPVSISDVPKYFIQSNSVHPSDVKKFLATYQKLADGVEKVDEIYRLRNQQSGEFEWIHTYYRRMENSIDAERMAVGFSINVDKQQDAVERFQIEQKLREQIYANAVMYAEYNLTDRKYEGENNLTQTYLSNKWEKNTEAVYRQNMSKIVAAPYLTQYVDKMYGGNLLKAFDNGETRVSCEYRSTERLNMPSIWYRTTAVMVKRPDSGDVMAFIYIEEIEEEKNRQIALDSSMSDGIEILSIIQISDGRASVVRSGYTEAPGGLRKNFTYNEEFVRRSHMGVVSDDREFSYQAALLSTVLKELKTKEIYQYSISTKRKNESLKRQLFRFKYLDDRKTNVILSVSNITDVYMEEQVRNAKLEAALIEAKAANNAKTDFLSRVSHDMRTPLNGILGLTTLLKEATMDQSVLKDLSELEMSGKYLLDLINDTLDMSRIESGRLELHPVVYDGKTMLNNVIRLGKMAIKGRNITFNVHTDNIPFTLLYVDVSRFEQIFMNVFGNAVKFTPDGGTIDFTMTNISIENGVITDKLVIADTGIGMSEEFIPHIFEAFSQGDTSKTSTTQGTGLGMSITKQLVESMGGSISLESELGKGSVFTIILKFQMATDEQILQHENNQNVSVDSVDLEGKRILLCEDHPLNTKIASRLLEAKGMVVEHAENGQVGVDMFMKSDINYYDAILMDIRMPVMDGIEATKVIRNLSRADARTMTIIAMTANAFADDIEQTRAVGMNGHLSKPIETKLLYATLAEKINNLH